MFASRTQEVTGCRIFIRGKDIGDKFQSDEEQLYNNVYYYY